MSVPAVIRIDNDFGARKLRALLNEFRVVAQNHGDVRDARLPSVESSVSRNVRPRYKQRFIGTHAGRFTGGQDEAGN